MKNSTRLSAFNQLMLAFLVFITGMLLCRFVYAGSFRFIFLLWNLFLAWIPLQLSLRLSFQRKSKWKNWLLLGGWLLFFPNALYIITDLIHLESRSNVPAWYDAILLFTAASMGLIMAFGSLYKVEVFLSNRLRPAAVNKIIILLLFIGSFGVYLGRFLRWNSWDIITNPVQLMYEIALRLIYPISYYQTWAITFLLTAFFTLVHFAIIKFRQYHNALLDKSITTNSRDSSAT